MPETRFNSFAEFWPFYVSQHSRRGTRVLHAIGTTASVVCLALLIATRKWYLLPLALVPGYGAAWLAHFLIEKNKPATFTYPLWSFIGDYKMIAMMIAGRMATEVKRGQTDSER